MKGRIRQALAELATALLIVVAFLALYTTTP